MSYATIKLLHVSCALLSVAGFALRGWWMLRDNPLLQHRLSRILPHLIDTVLLGSAIALAWLSQQYPLQQHWLSAKVLALLVYIGLGTFALKRGKTRTGRAVFCVLALVVAVYILAVAHTRNALLF